MPLPNFSSLAGLEETEKCDLIYRLGGWLVGQVAGESRIKANLSFSLSSLKVVIKYS